MTGMYAKRLATPYILLRTVLIISLAWGLFACAMPGGMQTRTDEPVTAKVPETIAESIPATSAEPQAQPLTQQLLYDILMGEISGQRGRFDVSVPHYLQAALDSNDPRVAERAVTIATFGKQFEVAARAARRWIALDPDNLEARKVLTALALRAGQPDEVVEQLEYIITASADLKEGFGIATVILVRHADKEASLQAMERLAARYPESPEGQLGLSRVAVLSEDMTRALQAVERALEMQPGATQAEILRAQILIQQDRKTEALQALERAVARAPKDADLHFAYGRLLLDADDKEGARQQFRHVVSLDPANADALFSLALLELDAKETKAAEQHLKQLLELGEKQQSVYYYLGYAAQEQGNEARAIEWYRKVEDGEYWMQSRLRIGKLMASQGRLEEMRAEMQALRWGDPENAVPIYLIEGQVLSDLNLYQEAFALYEQALVSDPENEELLYSRALVAEKIDRIDLAEHDMRRILANDPGNVRTLNALGYTLADRTDRYEEALQYIQQAYAQKPDDPAIIDSMGWVHFRLGKLNEAKDYLQKAWDMTGDGEIGAHLGEVLWTQGEHDEARRIWEESRKNAPDNPVLNKVLERFMP
jgi:tetratricopeptide (TPR) repeat protein